MPNEYFTSEKLTDRVTRIRDVCGVGIYLVEGKDRACVIDTGHGLGNLREYVEGLTDKPVFVILTHGHIDHVGGAALWEEVYMNPADQDLFNEHNSMERRCEQLGADPASESVPESDYVPARTTPLLPLMDGQTFDLGGVTIKAISAPGHTPGMMMMLIPEERMMLFGDACGLEVLLFFEDSSTVSEYLEMLRGIKNYEDQYDRIIRNHGTCESPKELLDNVICCCEDVLNGTDAAQEIVWHGVPVLSARLVDEDHQRLDGRQGNILYTEEKRR